MEWRRGSAGDAGNERGVSLAPSAHEAGFTSMAHEEQVIGDTPKVAREAFKVQVA
ncbi:MAG: hypothetical protein IPH43_13350 [Xanthomonadales bacterium]|uniref:hypothetical protein n=1 Tax=Dokdonella sp. TaxID=2291710 RepID=UPI0031C05548|nr:hypothetical protein [Xanthomonadales bacterium]MBK7013495.1 hypothetical protein [Xanthomonadales bacterium]MBK7210870.1 hypothetical protein [Xanthomonadales bacterium]